MEKHISKNYPNPVEAYLNKRVYMLEFSYDRKIKPHNNIIHAGTFISDLFLYKSGKCFEGVTGTAVKFYKEHNFGVGDRLFGTHILSIDDSNEEYDVFIIDISKTFVEDETYYNVSSFPTDLKTSVIIETIDLGKDFSGDKVAILISDIAVINGNARSNYDKKTINYGLLKIY